MFLLFIGEVYFKIARHFCCFGGDKDVWPVQPVVIRG
jgi:hypothetical protein